MTLGAIPLAIETINNDPNLLPGRKLQFVAADIGNPGMSPRPIPCQKNLHKFEFWPKTIATQYPQPTRNTLYFFPFCYLGGWAKLELY